MGTAERRDEVEWVSPVTQEQIQNATPMVEAANDALIKDGNEPLALVRTPEELEQERIRRALGK